MDAFGTSIMLGFSALLGFNQAFVKIVNGGLAPVFQSGLRSLCAFLPVLIYALVVKKRLSVTDGSLTPGLISGLLFCGEFCLLFTALDYTTVARASLFFYIMPFWVAIGAHFLIPEERLTRGRVMGLAIALGGVTYALLSISAVGTDDAWIGDLLCIFASMFWAGIALVARTTRLSRSTPEMQLLYQLAVSAVILIAIAPLFGDLVREVTPTIVAIFAFQVIVVVAIGFVVWFWVLSVYPISNMASFALLTPLFGVLAGWLIFDDQLTLAFVVSLILVGSGIFLINRPQQRGTTS
ncbi:MAG: DMT family transporter [Gammaproteobacteria bacterium]|nr:DMT family transporter [Gammaproteobacteria bacterium]